MFARKTPWPQRRGVFVFALLIGCAPLWAGAWARTAVSPPSLSLSCSIKQLPQSLAVEKVTVKAVTDGDTLRLTDGRKVRLVGVNTPELHGADGRAEAHAEKAKQATAAFFSTSKAALLAIDKEGRDRHGRVLGHVFNVQGENLEAHLLRQGLAWHVAVPPNLSMAQCLAETERLARDQQTGVWRQAAVAVKNIRASGFYRVQGRVDRVTFAKAWWLNFDDGLAAVVYPENHRYFTKAELGRLSGKTVELQGWVYPSGDDRYPWRIRLETPYGFDVP